MKEAVEVLQIEIAVIKTHIRKMVRLSDEYQTDLVKDWPKKVAVLELAIKHLLKLEVANNSASTSTERDESDHRVRSIYTCGHKTSCRSGSGCFDPSPSPQISESF